jgi:hypothetical protein
MLMRLTSFVLSCCLLATLSTPASAEVIIDNSAGTIINATALGFGTDGHQGATTFTMGATPLNLDFISVEIGSNNATLGRFDFTLHADGGTTPGTLIEDFGVQATASLNGATSFQVFNSAINPTLAANMKYWVVATRLNDLVGGSEGNPKWVAYSDIPNTGTGILDGGVFFNKGGGFSVLAPGGSIAIIV